MLKYINVICSIFYGVIVNDRLSALELATTPDMGHDGWANDVTLGNVICLHRVFIYIRTQK